MDLTSLTQSLQTALGGHLPTILGAVGIGLIGWIAAIIVRSVARRGFTAIGLDSRVNKAAGTQWPVTKSVSTGLYALILLMTVIAVLNALNLGGASGPLSTLATEVLAFLPKLVAAVVLAAVAWVVATVVRSVLNRVLAATSLDSRMSSSTVTSASSLTQARAATPLSGQLAQAGFWFTLLMFLPAVLDALKLDGLLSPVQGMMTNLLGIVPNILAAAAIGIVGYLVATLLRAIVTNLLEAAGANRASRTLGLSESPQIVVIGRYGRLCSGVAADDDRRA